MGLKIDARHVGAARSQQPAPAPDAAPDIQYAGSGADLQPWLERQPLLQVNRAIVELRHAVGTDRGQSVRIAREALRPILPIQARAIALRRGNSAHASFDHPHCSPIGDGSDPRGFRSDPGRSAAGTA